MRSASVKVLIAMSDIDVVVKFYDPGYEFHDGLIYSVIAANYMGKWIFVRHRDRLTWEIPGGHIDDDESPMEAARRELEEETGAVTYSIVCVATYSVLRGAKSGWGRLFFAGVTEMGPLTSISEIAEVLMDHEMPLSLTYPDIQPHLLGEVIRYIQGLPS